MYNKSVHLYKEKRYQTDDKKQILILLYEKMILLLEESIEEMLNYKSYEKINKNLKKVNEIFEELRNSIDLKQGEISNQLYQIYTFLIEQTTKANMEKKSEPLKEVKKIVNDLLAAWRKVNVPSFSDLNTKKNESFTARENLNQNTEKGKLKISI